MSASQINHGSATGTDPNSAGDGTIEAGAAGLTLQPATDGGKCLQVQSNATGVAVGVGVCNGTTAQRWAYLGGALQNLGARQCLDVGTSAAINANVPLTVQPCDATRPGQAWIVDHGILYLANGSHPVSMQLSVTPPLQDTTVELTTVDFNAGPQLWVISATAPSGGAEVSKGFPISPAGTNNCLDLNGTTLVSNTCTAAPTQHWTWLITGQLQSVSDANNCLDLPSNANTVGILPMVKPCDPNSATQEWISTGGEFVNNAVTQCADANGMGTANAAVHLTTCNGAATQQWEIGATP